MTLCKLTITGKTPQGGSYTSTFEFNGPEIEIIRMQEMLNHDKNPVVRFEQMISITEGQYQKVKELL